MTTTNLIDLYSSRILELSTNIPYLGKLANPQGWAQKRSPICGSVVRVGLCVKGNEDACEIEEFAQEVNACALGQASAAILGTYVIGLNKQKIKTARDALEQMLKTGKPYQGRLFRELEILKPAHEFPNRHASILLSFDATLMAFEKVSGA